jgi:DNA-3-methyladenine glycosylase I
MDEVPTQTELSRQVSLQLRKQGFRFIGPVTTQSFMQAVGMVNDHLLHCFRHPEHPL